jgi:hypothetical protein
MGAPPGGRGWRVERVKSTDPRYCDGEVVPFIEGESSWRCRDCGWIGWPVTQIDWTTHTIVAVYPHLRAELDRP